MIRELTLSITLLVRTTLDTFLPFFAVRIDTFFGYTVFDTTEAGSSVVTFLAGLLTVGASVLDLSALAACGLRRHQAGRKGIHVHRHA